MNWVKREVEAHRNAVVKGQDVWNGLCVCFQEAIDEYQQTCSEGIRQARLHITGNSASIQWTGHPDDSRFCAIEFDPPAGAISFLYPERVPECLRGPLKLKAQADKYGAMHLVMDGKGITFEQCSELVLRWVLFGE